MKSISKMFLFIVLFGILTASISMALPTGTQTLEEKQDQRLEIFPAKSNDAVAGNITELDINTWSVTRTWQGYYGNITGTIVLSDQSNNTLYDWSNTNPNGRIYAARVNNVDWTTIACAADSIMDDTEADFTLTNETDRNGNWPVDAPNLTFERTLDGDTPSVEANYSTFWVGPVEIKGSGDAAECYSTVLHNSTTLAMGEINQNGQNDINHWREVVLADTAGTGNIVYTAILEQNYAGFDARPHDFQMLVGENGHGTNVAITPYFFYVELE